MIIRLVKCKFLEEAIQTDEIDQISEEYIEIVDSADVQVTTTDTKVRYLSKRHYKRLS